MSIVLQGSTSGSITLQEPAIAGSTVLDLPATSGTVLVGGTQNIPKSALPTGSVLQVVQYAATPGIFSTTSTSFVATNTAATITPTSSSSKILIFYNSSMYANTSSCQPVHTVYRNATNLGGSNGFGRIYTSAGDLQGAGVGIYLDSPATTSAITYTVYVKTNLGTMQWGTDSVQQVMTLMEIAA